MEYELVKNIDFKNRRYRVLKPSHYPAGIFSYIWVCLQSMYTFPNDLYYVDMKQFSTYYDTSVAITDNVWEYYFEQPHTPMYPKDSEIIAMGIWNNHPSGYCDLSNVTSEKKQIYCEIIKKNVRPLSHISGKVKSYLVKHNWKSKKVLGVHCRGTDSYLKQGVELYLNEVE